MAPTRVRIERILCPTDFSEFSLRALKRAVNLASWFEARVTALHVMPRTPWALPGDAYGTYVTMAADLSRARQEEEAKELARFIEPFLGEGAPIETTLVEGDPWREIQAAAEALPADLVVMGTHGRSGFEHLLLGSVTEKVLRRAPCPVFTVGNAEAAPSAGPLFRRILCAADLTKASGATLDMALSLAEENLAEVTLLHVVEGFLGETGPDLYRPVPDIVPMRRSFVEQARERLHDAGTAAHGFCDVSERVETGTAWREILRVAKETSADLIVMGAHGHGALGRLFLGSTTNQVVRHAPCPVLIVREMQARGESHTQPTAAATQAGRSEPGSR
jgi:nucleotide-binding universal stress UspA family protein